MEHHSRIVCIAAATIAASVVTAAQAAPIEVQFTAAIDNVQDDLGLFTFDPATTTEAFITITYDDDAPLQFTNAIILDSFDVEVGGQVFDLSSGGQWRIKDDIFGNDEYTISGSTFLNGEQGFATAQYTYAGGTAFSGLQFPTADLLDLSRPDLAAAPFFSLSFESFGFPPQSSSINATIVGVTFIPAPSFAGLAIAAAGAAGLRRRR